MAENKELSDLTLADHLRLAAEKLGQESVPLPELGDGKTLSEIELGFERATRELARLEVARRLNEEEPATPKKCPRCGKRCRVRAYGKKRTLMTLSGSVIYHRHYHYCDDCSSGFYPRDEQYSIPESGEVSLEVERRILDFAMNDPFAHGATRFSLHYGFPVSENLLRRVFARSSKRLTSCDEEWIQGAIKPPETSSPDSTIIVESDGSMVSTTKGWKEVKLGMVYGWEPSASRKERPSPRFVASMEGTEAFEDQLEQALHSHCVERPETVVWLGDGAAGFWNIANRVCPDAHQVLDWYHAVEHAADCAKILFAEDTALQAIWIVAIKGYLMRPTGIETVLAELEACLFLASTVAERTALKDLRRYYSNHQHQMRYHFYREQGWPIGSGSIESAHRYVLQARMKRAGQHWSPPIATNMA
ncbi:MAG: ISKra4 family transposase, partial [Gammaproteobacteria bacterium]|nr:ISKra4 family transposase [Gammaproteobacteria bacterium]